MPARRFRYQPSGCRNLLFPFFLDERDAIKFVFGFGILFRPKFKISDFHGRQRPGLILSIGKHPDRHFGIDPSGNRNAGTFQRTAVQKMNGSGTFLICGIRGNSCQ